MQSVAAAARVGQQALPKGTDAQAHNHQWAQDSGWPAEAPISPTAAEPLFLLEEEKTNFFPLNLKETSCLVQLEII